MAPSATLPEPEPEYIVVHGGKGTIRRAILHGANQKPTFSTIPQVDFSQMSSSSLKERKAIAEQVGSAFRNSGFLYAVNHGISRDLQDRLTRVIQEFFALDEEEKMKIHVNKSETVKGYEALLETKLDDKTRGDYKEAFAKGDDPYDEEQNAPPGLDMSRYPKNGNQWPASPEFRKVFYEYNAAVQAFSKKLLRIVALALDLDEGFFDHMSDFPMASLRAVHYPPQETSADVGIGAHADFSWFTLVNQLTDTPGLEVLNHNGHWVAAPPIPNTLVVNVGDFLEMASNGVFVSTIHRVINKTGKERLSIPYFFSPSADVMIETFPTCITEEKKAMVPIRAGDWQRERLLRARYKHPSTIAARARGEI